MTGGGNGRRGSSATWRSSLSRGLGLEGTWGGRTRPDPRAGDVAREPQQSRLKTFREKPCRKTRYHLRGSQHRIYYTSSSKDVEAEMEAEDAVSFVPVWEIAAHVQCGAGQRSEPHQPDSASCPCPSSPGASTSLPSVPPRPPVTSPQGPLHTPEPSTPACLLHPAGYVPLPTNRLLEPPQTHPPLTPNPGFEQTAPPNLKRLSTCTPEPTTPFLCPYTNVPFRETSLRP